MASDETTDTQTLTDQMLDTYAATMDELLAAGWDPKEANDRAWAFVSGRESARSELRTKPLHKGERTLLHSGHFNGQLEEAMLTRRALAGERAARQRAEGERDGIALGRDRAIADLAQCYRLSGADPDGNEDWRLATRAVKEVGRLRREYDEACDCVTDAETAAQTAQVALAAAREREALAVAEVEETIAHWSYEGEVAENVRAAFVNFGAWLVSTDGTCSDEASRRWVERIERVIDEAIAGGKGGAVTGQKEGE